MEQQCLPRSHEPLLPPGGRPDPGINATATKSATTTISKCQPKSRHTYLASLDGRLHRCHGLDGQVGDPGESQEDWGDLVAAGDAKIVICFTY